MQAYVIMSAGIGWASVIGRYLAGAHFESLAQTVLYFSYFTILSNILATLTLTEMAFRPADQHRYLTRPAVVTATTLYVSVTGLSTLPPPAWFPHQWLLICDSLMHYLMPILFFTFWMIDIPKGSLSFRHMQAWLIFPICYCIYSQLCGPFYHAFDVKALGISQVLANTGWMSICFVSLSANLVVIDHALARRPAPIAQVASG